MSSNTLTTLNPEKSPRMPPMLEIMSMGVAVAVLVTVMGAVSCLNDALPVTRFRGKAFWRLKNEELEMIDIGRVNCH